MGSHVRRVSGIRRNLAIEPRCAYRAVHEPGHHNCGSGNARLRVLLVVGKIIFQNRGSTHVGGGIACELLAEQ